MSKIEFTYVDNQGSEVLVSATPGETLMEVATGHGVAGIDGDCGGCCACGTCCTQLDVALAASVPPMGDEERDILEFADDITEGARLGCQIKVDESFAGVRVVVAT